MSKASINMHTLQHTHALPTSQATNTRGSSSLSPRSHVQNRPPRPTGCKCPPRKRHPQRRAPQMQAPLAAGGQLRCPRVMCRATTTADCTSPPPLLALCLHLAPPPAGAWPSTTITAGGRHRGKLPCWPACALRRVMHACSMGTSSASPPYSLGSVCRAGSRPGQA